MLAVTKRQHLGRPQAQGIAGWCGRQIRFVHHRQRRLADGVQGFRIHLDAPGRRGEAARDARKLLGIGLVRYAGREGDAAGRRAQLRDAQARRREHAVVPGIDAATEELLIHAQALRQRDNDVGVAFRLADRGDHGRAQLHAPQGFKAGIEARAQTLALP